MEKYFKIGQRFRMLRGNSPQKVYAKKIGISHQAYQNYESGKRIPQAQTLNKIAEKESVTVDWILTGDLRSLMEKLLSKEIELSFLHGGVNQLEKELIDDLHKRGIPIPKNIDAFIEIGKYLIKQGKLQEFFDLLMFDKTSPLFIMKKQIERIFLEGHKEKLKGLRGVLKALDPGEKKQDSDTQPHIEGENNNP